jgi:hypothetical protein
MRKKTLLGSLVLAVFLLHQDGWNWAQAGPLVFGVLPPGLAYHAGYAVLAALLMAVLVKFAWPAELDRVESKPDDASNAPKP